MSSSKIKFREIKLKSFFSVRWTSSQSQLISLKQYLKIVDIVGIKSFLYFFSIITTLTCIFIHSFVDIHESLALVLSTKT